MISFKNEKTSMFFGMSLQVYSDMFNLADEDTQRVIYTKVMDPEFVISFIGLAIIMAEKCFRDSVWK